MRGPQNLRVSAPEGFQQLPLSSLPETSMHGVWKDVRVRPPPAPTQVPNQAAGRVEKKATGVGKQGGQRPTLESLKEDSHGTKRPNRNHRDEVRKTQPQQSASGHSRQRARGSGWDAEGRGLNLAR